MAKRTDPVVAFSKFPSDLQSAVLAVTHLEDETLANVVRATQRAMQSEYWMRDTWGVDAHLNEIRSFIRLERQAAWPREIATRKVVSLAAFRKAKEYANG